MMIAGRSIGPDWPPYVIAELGVNHDGSPERLLELVEHAAGAGADAIKLQLFRADLLLGRAARLAEYQAGAGETDPFEMLRRLELGAGAMRPAVELAHTRGLQAIVTVFNLELVPDAEGLGPPGRGFDAYKTASPDLINRPLLSALEATGRPLIVSTGAATLDEVERAAGWLARASERLAFLQCVSAYPTPEPSASLGGIVALARTLGGPVGYSDHTTRVETGGLAVALGACVLEKHLTFDRSASGPDHAASLEPGEMARYVELARAAHTMLGPPEKRVLPLEEDVRGAARQSLCAARDLPQGHALARADLVLRRPGLGLEPWRLDDVLGRTTSRALSAGEPIAEDDLR